ncbi:hypothetical protein Q5P01_002526 [Channa striata]|uniref:Poly [ADP-ribose] polymerase n=1 Tax=Channa striata TaxID=64152 RepID=A0AA88NTC7_CHASR|nr:hypothetical protein Q5P01_002526 [Channa striata]
MIDISSELVDCFHKLFDLTAMKKTKVTMKTSNVPHPSVFISGPYCLVQEVRADLNAKLAGVTSDTLVLDGRGAQRYFQTHGKITKELVESFFHVVIREKVYSPDPKPKASAALGLIHSHVPSPEGTTVLLRTWQSKKLPNCKSKLAGWRMSRSDNMNSNVNVLVVPMLNKGLASTKIGKCLMKKGGSTIRRNFALMAATCTLAPGDILQLDGSPSLGCSKIYFIECLPWDGVKGQSVQALGNGLKRCLDLCVQQCWCSVAFPVIGPGIVLKYPLREAIRILTDTIHQFGLSASSGSLSKIHIVIRPDYPDSEECYSDVHRRISLIRSKGGQVIVTSLTSDLDEFTMTVGGIVKLQLVFGDITNETTDAVVNTTDFSDYQSDSVCKDILTKAGPHVEAILKSAKVNRGDVFQTQPGSFPCKAILHVCGDKDVGLIEHLVCRIIQHCESSGYKSVAIPAICAGAGGLDPDVVALAILRGIKTATSSTPLHFLTNIRLVLIKIHVFMAFKHQTTLMFSHAVVKSVSVAELLCKAQKNATKSINADINTLCTRGHQSVFQFVGLCEKNVKDAKTKLKDLYLAQCLTKTFMKDQLEGLTQDDLKSLKQLVEAEGLYVQRDEFGPGRLTVSGPNNGVSQVVQMICTITPLKRNLRLKEEEDLYNRVTWCILGHRNNWERLPKTANYSLENNDRAGGILDAQGISWSVDLQRMEAKREGTGEMAKLKRLQNPPDLTLPLDWDSMTTAEDLKVVTLESSSAEYQTVKKDFRKTATNTIVKIQRVQNLHLLRTYEMQKKHISALRSRAEEKLLYHGTTQENCDSIMHTGFNRSFAGQNGTSYGQGTYFAVKASYSANSSYSRPAADGCHLMFVARVLTGSYTVGNSSMKVPPPLNSQQPHDRYDSLVDRIDKPSMFVVFHDSQAYPDYLITFK